MGTSLQFFLSFLISQTYRQLEPVLMGQVLAFVFPGVNFQSLIFE